MSHRKDAVPFLNAQDETMEISIWYSPLEYWDGAGEWYRKRFLLCTYISTLLQSWSSNVYFEVYFNYPLFCTQYVKSQFYFDSKTTKAASILSREKMRKNLAVVFKFHSRTPTTLCLHYIRENNKLTTEKDAHTQSLTHSRTHS